MGPTCPLPFSDEEGRQQRQGSAPTEAIGSHPGRRAGGAAGASPAASEADRGGGFRRLVGATIAVAVLLGAGGAALDRWIATAPMPGLVPAVSATVLDRDGQLLRAYQVADGRWRLPVDPAEVDRGYLAQLLAFEDRRFYDHAGVDLRAMARAAWQAVRHGRAVSGASTLTMQVARLLQERPTDTLGAKLAQIRLALALERRLSKAEILRLYLMLAPFGGNVEGVRAASLVWFGKEPRRLTPAESALLVALPQSPEGTAARSLSASGPSRPRSGPGPRRRRGCA